MYAHVTNGTVDSVVGAPPYLVFQDGRWWDLRSLDLTVLAMVGWYPVNETQKPADTATTTWSPVFTLLGYGVQQTWSERPKTPDELTATTSATNLSTIDANLLGDLTTLDTRIAEMATLIGTANATINSSPASYIKNLAQALRDCMQAEKRLIRKVRGVLDSAT